MGWSWIFYIVKHPSSFLQFDTTAFGECGQACPDSQSVCRIFGKGNISNRTWCDDLIFYMYEDLHQTCRKFCYFRWGCWGQCSWPIKLCDCLKCNISWTKCGMKWIFLWADKYQSFLQVHTTIFGRRGPACLSSQSIYKILRSVVTSVISYEQSLEDEGDISHADKNFVQVDTTIFGSRGRACQGSQSSSRILRSIISHKVRHRLP